jgi:hypothetical protein
MVRRGCWEGGTYFCLGAGGHTSFEDGGLTTCPKAAELDGFFGIIINYIY